MPPLTTGCASSETLILECGIGPSPCTRQGSPRRGRPRGLRLDVQVSSTYSDGAFWPTLRSRHIILPVRELQADEDRVVEPVQVSVHENDATVMVLHVAVK